MSKFEVIHTDGRFTTLRERRGIWAVKKYLHRWVMFEGQEMFCKYRRKHNRDYIEVAHHQFIVDEVKTFFELNKMGTKIVFDDIEGYGIMLKWHQNIGTVKMREFMPLWVSDKNLIEIVKICLFDGVIGGLDRHGNNVLVLNDKTLMTIDDEDVFYDKLRVWIKFDKDIKRMAYMTYLKNKDFFPPYIQRLKDNKNKILEFADCDVMRNNEQYKFFDVLERNLNNIDWIFEETIRQLLL